MTGVSLADDPNTDPPPNVMLEGVPNGDPCAGGIVFSNADVPPNIEFVFVGSFDGVVETAGDAVAVAKFDPPNGVAKVDEAGANADPPNGAAVDVDVDANGFVGATEEMSNGIEVLDAPNGVVDVVAAPNGAVEVADVPKGIAERLVDPNEVLGVAPNGAVVDGTPKPVIPDEPKPLAVGAAGFDPKTLAADVTPSPN